MSSRQIPTKRKRKVPWVRRIVSTLILLALVAGILFLVFRVVSWVGSYFQEEHQKNTELTTLQPVSYETCSAKDVSVTLTPDAATVLQGEGTNVVLSMSNTGNEPCLMSPGNVSVSMVLGGDTIWTPTACTSGLTDLTLLLSSDQPWSKTLSWDGKAYLECEVVKTGEDDSPMNAAKGTYELRYAVLGTESKIGANVTVE